MNAHASLSARIWRHLRRLLRLPAAGGAVTPEGLLQVDRAFGLSGDRLWIQGWAWWPAGSEEGRPRLAVEPRPPLEPGGIWWYHRPDVAEYLSTLGLHTAGTPAHRGAFQLVVEAPGLAIGDGVEVSARYGGATARARASLTAPPRSPSPAEQVENLFLQEANSMRGGCLTAAARVADQLGRSLAKLGRVASRQSFGTPHRDATVDVVIPLHANFSLLGPQLSHLVACDFGAQAAITYVASARTAPEDLAERIGHHSALYQLPLQLLLTEETSDFAAQVNLAVREGSNPLVGVLHSDTFPETPEFCRVMTRAFGQRPEVAAAMPMLLLHDDSIGNAGLELLRSHTAREGWSLDPRLCGYPRRHPAALTPARVDGLETAALFLRREAFEAVGGLHGLGAAYGDEGNDLARRLDAAGRECWYLPAAAAYHAGGYSYRRDRADRLAPLRKRSLHHRWSPSPKDARRLGGLALGELPDPARLHPPRRGYTRGPLVVLGAARSGTTVLARALKRHLGMDGWNEGHVLGSLSFVREAMEEYRTTVDPALLAPASRRYFGCSTLPPAELERAAVGAILATYERAVGSRAWLDKTPTSWMIRAAPVLATAAPEARFLFIYRNGIGNLESRRRKFPDMAFESHCREWASCMLAWREVREELGERALEIDHAELSRGPAATAARLADFLELPAHLRDEVAAFLQGSFPEQTSLTPHRLVPSLATVAWTEDEKACFERICGPMMEAYGLPLSGVGAMESLDPIRLFWPHSDPIVTEVHAPGAFSMVGGDKFHFILEPGPPGGPRAQVTYPSLTLPQGGRFRCDLSVPADAASGAHFHLRSLREDGGEDGAWTTTLRAGESHHWDFPMAAPEGPRRLQLATERTEEGAAGRPVLASWGAPRIEFSAPRGDG